MDIEIPGWTNLDLPFGFYLDSAYCRPRKIVDNGSLAAAGSVVLWEDSAWLGHIIVAQNYRRRGLGAAITRDLIELAQQHGIYDIRLLASELGAPLYETLGFVARENYLLFSACTGIGGGQNAMIRALPRDYFPAVLALDFATTGDRRDRLWYTHPTPGLGIIDHNGDVRGVFQPEIGEGVILATDEEAGLALLNYKHATEQPKAVVPATNVAAIAFLESIGAIRVAEQVLMTLGTPPVRRSHQIYSRAAGFLG